MAELDPRSDLQQLRILGGRERARPRCRACRPARQTSVASPSGSAAASEQQPLRRLGQLADALAGSGPQGAQEDPRRREARSHPPAPPRSCRRGSSSRASGLPRVSATTRSRTRSSSRPGTAPASKARASSRRALRGAAQAGRRNRAPIGLATPRTATTIADRLGQHAVGRRSRGLG